MSISTNFLTTTPLIAGATFQGVSSLWDNVLPYTKYFIQLKTDKEAKISIYQCNDSTPALNLSNIYTLTYASLGETLIYEGDITCNNISFLLTNTSSENETNLYFSVLYR